MRVYLIALKVPAVQPGIEAQENIWQYLWQKRVNIWLEEKLIPEAESPECHCDGRCAVFSGLQPH